MVTRTAAVRTTATVASNVERLLVGLTSDRPISG
jgi:hypothetical protein